MSYADPIAGSPGAQAGLSWRIRRAFWNYRNSNPKTNSEGRSFHFTGDCHRIFGCNFRTVCDRGSYDLRGEVEFAVGALGAKALREFEFLAGATRKRQLSQRFSCEKIERDSCLFDGVAEQSALLSWMQCRQTFYVDREAVSCGSASSANRASGQNELRRKMGQFRLPPGFFVASQFGHVR
jgi:hypothetical protein